jgi:hypothetical protein
VAGVMIAITQPLRLGDWVEFEGNYGVVEDLTLSYTVVRTGAGQRVIIPNEKIASGVLRNDSLVAVAVALDVSVWLPPAAETGGDVTIAEQVPWGIRLAIGGEAVAPPDRYAREAELRARCLRRLRAEGLLQA